MLYMPYANRVFTSIQDDFCLLTTKDFSYFIFVAVVAIGYFMEETKAQHKLDPLPQRDKLDSNLSSMFGSSNPDDEDKKKKHEVDKCSQKLDPIFEMRRTRLRKILLTGAGLSFAA